jgi:hypothetical protein
MPLLLMPCVGPCLPGCSYAEPCPQDKDDVRDRTATFILRAAHKIAKTTLAFVISTEG